VVVVVVVVVVVTPSVACGQSCVGLWQVIGYACMHVRLAACGTLRCWQRRGPKERAM
jgi:hypothetical protein